MKSRWVVLCRLQVQDQASPFHFPQMNMTSLPSPSQIPRMTPATRRSCELTSSSAPRASRILGPNSVDGRGRETEFVVWSGGGGAADARMAANPHTFPSGAVVRCSLPSAAAPPVVVAVDEGGWPEKLPGGRKLGE